MLVEKAFTVSARQARAVLEAARSAGVCDMEAMWTRFLPGQVLLRHLASSGAMGALRYVRAEHFQHLLHVERLIRPELAGGALLDLGVYPVSFIHSLLGVPRTVQAVGRLSEAGVDLDEVVAMGYDGASAVACSAMDSRARSAAQVAGERARVELAAPFYGPVDLTVTRTDDGAEATWRGRVAGGFQFEAAELARCVAAGRQESAIMPWQATIDVMEIMDAVRAQLGVSLPGQ